MYATYESVYQKKRGLENTKWWFWLYLVYEIENLDSMQIQSN